MIRDYQDLTMTFDPENEDVPEMKAPRMPPPSQTWSRRSFPSRRLVLILLALSLVLTISVMVFGIKGHFYNAELKETQENVKSLNQTMGQHFAKLQQTENDADRKLAELEKKVKQLTEEANGATTHLLNQLKELRKNNIALNCDFQDFKLNRTDRKEACCPKGWDAFRKSCYWENLGEKSWQEAKAECESYDAHLVIINSYEEQQFVSVRVRPNFMWIGLTDSSGSWKWVDGSSYTMVSRDWCPEQPDNWYGHELGGGEDCTHFHRNGCWNDDHCSRHYSSVCEMEMDN